MLSPALEVRVLDPVTLGVECYLAFLILWLNVLLFVGLDGHDVGLYFVLCPLVGGLFCGLNVDRHSREYLWLFLIRHFLCLLMILYFLRVNAPQSIVQSSIHTLPHLMLRPHSHPLILQCFQSALNLNINILKLIPFNIHSQCFSSLNRLDRDHLTNSRGILTHLAIILFKLHPLQSFLDLLVDMSGQCVLRQDQHALDR